MRHQVLFYQILIGCVSSTLLTACAVGPDFQSPKQPTAKTYTTSPTPTKTVGVTQQFEQGKDLSGEWWTLFHSKQLNTLIETGLANSPNLASALAALTQAQETLNAQIGNLYYPAIDIAAGGARQRLPGANFDNSISSNLFNLFNAGVNVSYTLDTFGGSRRQIEALRAKVDYQRYQLLAAYLTLTSNIATTAITISSLQAQIEATQQLIKAEKNQLNIMQKQFELGGLSQENILTQTTLVQQTIATLPPLELSLAQSKHALAVLVGQYPNGALPEIKLSSLTLPRRLPVSVPSELVKHRPDIQAAEAMLHAAVAQVGVATANLYPNITLTGTYGYSGTVPSTLFDPINKAWSYGLQLAQPFFHGGQLRAQRRAAVATSDQMFANYRQTVLQAFQNVADALRAIENDAASLKALKSAESAASNNLYLVQKQYRLGGASYLDLLTAQEKYQTTVISAVKAKAARYTDTVALYQSLGGGWWNHSGSLCQLGERMHDA